MIDFVELGRKTNDLFFSSFHKIEDEHTLLHVQTHCCRFYFLFLIPKIFLILSQFLINKTIFFGLLFAAVSAAAFFFGHTQKNPCTTCACCVRFARLVPSKWECSVVLILYVHTQREQTAHSIQHSTPHGRIHLIEPSLCNNTYTRNKYI